MQEFRKGGSNSFRLWAKLRKRPLLGGGGLGADPPQNKIHIRRRVFVTVGYFLHQLLFRYKPVVLATFKYGNMFAGLACLVGETIAGHCCVEEQAFQVACGRSVRFARFSTKQRRRHNFVPASQSKAVCKDGIHCTALPQVPSALRWLVHHLLLYVNIMYVISHAYSTGRRTYWGFSWESKI